ncbi:MAG: hypothetical protein GC185_02015 [Alphaproteobacteria bacterium]|nr:hypothetical protein [Alphaproteobacteria bacterium]
MEIYLTVSLCLIMAAIISGEFNISSAVLEILAGVVLAAAVPDIVGANWLRYMAHIGMLALMFVAGFELQADKFKRMWRPSSAIGVSSLCVPMVGVYLYTRFGLHFDPMPAALVSIGLSTTSLALVYHVLKEQQILDTDEGQVIFAAASVVDVLSMVALALLLGSAGWGTAFFAAFLLISVFGLPHFGDWIFRRYPNSMAEPELRFLMVILVGMGFMAESVGSIHPALVAFTLGMIMTSVLEKNEGVKDKLMGLVFSFFAPLFFLSAGTRISLHALNFTSLVVAGALFVLATMLKFAGSALPAKMMKMTRHRYIGILFNYRLSFGIITANVGLETGIISEEFYSVLLLVVLVSAALPGILLRKGDGQKPDEDEEETRSGEEAPAALEGERPVPAFPEEGGGEPEQPTPADEPPALPPEPETPYS